MNKCIRRKIAWSSRGGDVVQEPGEQFLELLRAIGDLNVESNKDQKSYSTKWLENRYKNMIVNGLPTGWKPDAAIIDEMFLINSAPLSTHHTMKDYCTFLIRRCIVPWFTKGATEVHLIFDNPNIQAMSRKPFERRHRDNAGELPVHHQHREFGNTAIVPSKWREHLTPMACRCKQQLVLYLGRGFMEHIAHKLYGNQKLILAGCFDGHAENQA